MKLLILEKTDFNTNYLICFYFVFFCKLQSGAEMVFCV